MDTKRVCQHCGKTLGPETVEGLCPECLMKMGLGTETGGGSEPRRPFVAPAVAELTPKFPQLEILGFLGQGGMGAVYRARQKTLDRIVALKILPPGIGADPAFADRFQREARALARLNHPGIITIHDFGQAEGLFYFLMEYVDGVNLGQLLQAGRVSPREALGIVPQICDALQYAHDQGIVHRDIKPENVLVDRVGKVKVADFGLAKLIGAAKEGPGSVSATAVTPALTEAGRVMGTPNYMAPEQVEHPTEVDHRADIYALGVVFYQMLTGELPGKPLAPPSSKVRIDVRLDEVVLRTLERMPERRYQHASDVKTHVENIAGTPSAAHSLAASGLPEPLRRRLLLFGLGACVIGLPFSLAQNLPAIALLSLIGIMVALIKLRWFEPRLPAKGNYSLVLPLLLCVVPWLFTWFVLFGHPLFEIDLDADVQFFAGVLTLPVGTAIGGLLIWGVDLFRPASNRPATSSEARRFPWQTIIAIILLVLSLPVGGGTLVLVQLIGKDASWNPGSSEFVVMVSICIAALLLSLATTLAGLTAVRRIRQTPQSFRGWEAAVSTALFWPCFISGMLLLWMASGSIAEPRPGPLPPRDVQYLQ